ncbi:hypothetical protein AB07_3969 [Citrobacter freundii]|nr:hypothetical protein AB07_3969 [Citrobacter freundii]
MLELTVCITKYILFIANNILSEYKASAVWQFFNEIKYLCMPTEFIIHLFILLFCGCTLLCE